MADNPQAFPHLEPRNPEFSYCENGMTLLDYFAAKFAAAAVAAMLGKSPLDPQKLAKDAYAFAAAMLNERQSHEG